jgi:hypothetical protein
MGLEFYRKVLEKHTKVKFHKNPSSGSRVVPCGQTEMTKIIVAFLNFASAPKTLAYTEVLINYVMKCIAKRRYMIHAFFTPT